jgi:hypothetical protein
MGVVVGVTVDGVAGDGVAVEREKETATRAAEPTAARSLVVDPGRDDGAATVTVARNGAAVGDAALADVADGTSGGVRGRGGAGVDGGAGTAVSAHGDGPGGGVKLAPGSDGLGVVVSGVATATPTVLVTRDGSPVGGVTVRIEAVGGYRGTGTYETDANGSVALPVPDEPRTVTATVVGGRPPGSEPFSAV